jgi:hypothetical protein
MKRFLLILPAIVLSVAGFTQPASSLNQKEKDAILYMREEEKLARDVYDSLYAKWEVNPFGNIRQSEQTHMNRMKTLTTDYKLEDPVSKNNDQHGVFVNISLQQYYNDLITSGSRNLPDALKAGAKIEELDIADLEERTRQTQRPDILSAYGNLKMASENHLNAFVRRLKMLDIPYEPVVLSKAEFDKIISNKDNRCGNGGK